ncbi:MAG: hypothetical protein CMG74_12965 [Candidatus Marinimicrobia bacterium]|nr:hypothetical protein [Candidatus Neomarinimicrobiota bacterium]|tara:strand:- start:73 stop:1515 length:1443 start_codon:yes stop_codon:yes gene_type:complete
MNVNIGKLGKIIDCLTGEVWSQKKLFSEVNKRTAYLYNNGINNNSKLILAHGGSPAFFADLFSCWNLGAMVACINPSIKKFEMENIVNFLEPDAIITNKNKINMSLNVSTINLSKISSNTRSFKWKNISILDNPSLMLFTSGTTGTPKGVVHTFRSIASRISLNQKIIGSNVMDVSLCPLPTHFGHGLIGNCLTPLLNGDTLILLPGSDIKNIVNLGKFIDDYEVTFLSSVPTMWKIATKSQKPEKNTIKRVHVGSAPLSSDLWQEIIEWCGTKNVCNMYGITETANWLAGANANDCNPEDGLIGNMWGGEAMIIDKDNNFSSFGKGELIVQSPSLMSGYYKLEEQNKKVFINGWFRTGDIGEIDEKGNIRLTGRKKFEINRAGLKVNPEDIDLLLEKSSFVMEACAFGIPDEIAGEIVGVAIKIDNKDNLDKVKEWCSNNLLKEKLPEKWYLVDEIPKSDRGKINRATVASICLNLNNE